LPYYPEDGGSKLLRNVGIDLTDYRALYPRRGESSEQGLIKTRKEKQIQRRKKRREHKNGRKEYKDRGS
jgi:hypothetical protein